MFYSFKINTPLCDKQVPFNIIDKKRIFRYYAGRLKENHYYCNLIVDSKPRIDFPGEHEIEELSIGENLYFTDEQIKRNQVLSVEDQINFHISVHGNPSQAIITGAHYAGDLGTPTPYPVLMGENFFGFDDTLYISFQDCYFSHGSYMLSDNYGNPIIEKAVNIIRKYILKYNIPDNKCTFIGASKGANIAAMLSQYFNDNQLILCAYATDLNFWIRNTGMSHIGLTLDYLGVKIPDSEKILRGESSRKETHWFYSNKDFKANRNLEFTLESDKLIKHSCSSAHGAVLIDNKDNISNIILNRKN